MTQPFAGYVDEFVPVYRLPWPTERELVLAGDYDESTKVFCPTGPGGGIDPTCSSGESSGSNAPPADRGPKQIPITNEVVVSGESVDSYDIDAIRNLMTDDEKAVIEDQIQESIDASIEVLVDEEMSGYDVGDHIDYSAWEGEPPEDELQAVRDEIELQYRQNLENDYSSSYSGTEETRQAYYDFYKENEDRYTAKESKKGIWGFDESGDRAFVFETKTGKEYQIWAVEGSGGPSARLGEPVTEIGFMDENESYGIQNNSAAMQRMSEDERKDVFRNAMEVFRNVTEATTALVKEKQYPIVYFSAAEPSRQKLYDRMVKSIAHDLPEYSAAAGTYSSGSRGYIIAPHDKIEKLMESISKYNVEPQMLVGRRAVVEPDKMKWELLTPEKNPAWFEDEMEWSDLERDDSVDRDVTEAKKSDGNQPGQSPQSDGSDV